MAGLVHGSCNCGRHKFSIPKPTEMNLCHCIDCCKWAGAFHSAHLLIPSTDVQAHGPAPQTWQVTADSGNAMERAFCGACGAGIWIRSVGGESTNLKAGLFRREDVPVPTMENWMKNMEKWETPAKGTKRQAFDGN